MTDWEKYEVPDWVVDDYNSRVSEKDRMPLGSYSDMETEDDWIPMSGSTEPITKSIEPSAETEEYNYSNLLFAIFFTLCFLVWAIFASLRQFS